jgi:transposase
MKKWHIEARRMFAAGMTKAAIARHFGVYYSTVARVVDDEDRVAAFKRHAKWQKNNPHRVREYNAKHHARKRERALAIAREYGCEGLI